MFKSLRNILCVLLIIILIPVLIISGVILIDSFVNKDEIPSFFGWKPFIVLSGSMEDEISAGDLVIVKEENTKDLKKGDIIAFKSGETVVTHRIYEIKNEEGITKIITKGDNNNTEDIGYVTEQQVEGVYKFKISGLGNTALFIQTPTGMIACLSIPLLILIIMQIVQSNKEKAEARQREEKQKMMEDEIKKLKEEKEKILK